MKNYLKRWLQNRLWLMLASPDGNSARQLTFWPFGVLNGWSCNLTGKYHKGSRPRLERLLDLIGVYPEW